MSTRIKICGFTDPDTVRAAAALGVDWAGFVFVEKSPRHITQSAAQTLLLGVGDMTPVALLVDPDDALIDDIANLGFRVLQLHGNESPARVEEIKRRTGLEIWKAIGVSTPDNLVDARQYYDADRLLFDAKPPEASQVSGGHGRAFDWTLIAGWADAEGDVPAWILAGGLTPDNVAGAILVTGADAVDVSSGVERVRGLKNAGLIADFVQAVRLAAP